MLQGLAGDHQPIALVRLDQVPFVQREVPFGFGERLERGNPFVAIG